MANESEPEIPDGSIPVYTDQGCYVLEDIEATTHYVKSNQRKETWLGLHKRLKHASKEVMINTLNNTYGIQLTTKDLDDFFCATCAIANSSRKGTSLLRNPDLKATKVGERVFCDIKTFKAPTRQGYNYYIIYVDEFSDWICIFPLNSKDQAASTLPKFKNELLAHSSLQPESDGASHNDEMCLPCNGNQPITLRPDGDPACFDTDKFKEACADPSARQPVLFPNGLTCAYAQPLETASHRKTDSCKIRLNKRSFTSHIAIGEGLATLVGPPNA